MTAEVMTGMTMPMPKPATAKGSTMLCHDASGTITRRVRMKPRAVTSIPANISHLGPTRSESVPDGEPQR